jgi:hypothetical protein
MSNGRNESKQGKVHALIEGGMLWENAIITKAKEKNS